MMEKNSIAGSNTSFGSTPWKVNFMSWVSLSKVNSMTEGSLTWHLVYNGVSAYPCRGLHKNPAMHPL